MIFKCVICTVFLVAINITDIKGYKIKNAAVFPTALAGLIYGAVCGSFLDSVYGMLIPMVLFPFFALKMLGAGDIKALCAIGAVLGLRTSIVTMLLTFISGGVIALLYMIFNRNFKERFINFFRYIKVCFLTRKLEKYNFGGGSKSYFRFSYAITVGTVLAILNNFLCLI